MKDISGAVRDPKRLEALRDTGLLDSEVEEQFDRLTRLASKLLRVPATFFSLVDEDRDFYKSCFGFEEPLSTQREMSGLTFCHYSLVSDGALVIPDTRADPVYRDVPTVASLGVAAYLGVPVHAPGGEVLGSFCAVDMEPNDWTPLAIETMKELAKSAEREVAIRDWMRRQRGLMEREFAAREELERVMESRGRLLRGFTHDVKNPLGAADGFLSLLEDGIRGELTPEQRESVGRARRAIGTGLNLIDELVQIARAEAGQLEIESVPVELGTLAGDTVEEYRSQAEVKGLRLDSTLPEEAPVIRSDPARIAQILGNLISNAVKYTSEGGVELAISVRSDDSAPGDGDWVAIDVSDTGPGIPEADMHLLFEEFTRLAPTASPGAGLGLAISQRLARALGGAISVKSVVGESSTFTLWLPLSASSGVGAPRQSHPDELQVAT